MPLLLKAAGKIEEYFSDTKCIIELFSDPDDPKSEELAILIPTNLSAANATPILESLENDWWLEQPTELLDKLILDLKYT